MLARPTELLHAARLANVGVVNDEMRRLIFFVLRSGVIEVSKLVECQLAVAFGVVEQVGFSAAVGREGVELLETAMAGSGGGRERF